MKDQEARNEIQKLRNDLKSNIKCEAGRLRKEIEALPKPPKALDLKECASLKIEVCPNCKHDTLNAFYSGSFYYFITVGDAKPQETHGDYYRCLTCGVKWEYNESPKIIKEKA